MIRKWATFLGHGKFVPMPQACVLRSVEGSKQVGLSPTGPAWQMPKFYTYKLVKIPSHPQGCGIDGSGLWGTSLYWLSLSVQAPSSTSKNPLSRRLNPQSPRHSTRNGGLSLEGRTGSLETQGASSWPACLPTAFLSGNPVDLVLMPDYLSKTLDTSLLK